MLVVPHSSPGLDRSWKDLLFQDDSTEICHSHSQSHTGLAMSPSATALIILAVAPLLGLGLPVQEHSHVLGKDQQGYPGDSHTTILSL